MSKKMSGMLILSVGAVALLLFFLGTACAATKTLHSEALVSFNKRAAAANPDDWCFVFMGDNRGNDGKFREALQLAARFEPLFILHGGDIVERGTADELAHFLDTVRSLPGLPPLFVVRGNHELNASLFEQLIGPRNFTLDNPRLGFRLVGVDNADNSLKEKELAFLGKMLDGRLPNQFVTMHVPPKTGRWSKHSFEKGKDELLRLLAERKVKLGLFAHIHLFDQDVINGVPCIISGGAGATLSYFGYNGTAKYHIVVVEVKKGKVSYRVEKLP
jgi:Icc-related predicted phosphoesterase